jgi:hypothetical protein
MQEETPKLHGSTAVSASLPQAWDTQFIPELLFDGVVSYGLGELTIFDKFTVYTSLVECGPGALNPPNITA